MMDVKDLTPEMMEEMLDRALDKYGLTITKKLNDVKLFRHVSNVCKPNLKRDAKICQNCPFRGIVDDAIKTMEEENGH